MPSPRATHGSPRLSDEAPSISNWPCAKLTICTVLKIQQQAKRNQSINAPQRQPLTTSWPMKG